LQCFARVSGGLTNFDVVCEPDVKINSVYYCDNIPEQGLLPYIRCLSNDDFPFQQDGAPTARHTIHATLSLICAPMCLSSLNRKTDRQTVRI